MFCIFSCCPFTPPIEEIYLYHFIKVHYSVSSLKPIFEFVLSIYWYLVGTIAFEVFEHTFVKEICRSLHHIRIIEGVGVCVAMACIKVINCQLMRMAIVFCEYNNTVVICELVNCILWCLL